MELCKTDIQTIERLLKQCSDKIEKYAPKTSPDQRFMSKVQEYDKKVKQ